MPLDPEDSPGFLLWHVTLRWQREIAVLPPLGAPPYYGVREIAW